MARPACGVLVKTQADQYLLLREKRNGKSVWNVPGGKPDPNEAPHDTAWRVGRCTIAGPGFFLKIAKALMEGWPSRSRFCERHQESFGVWVLAGRMAVCRVPR